jgi:hypothetical protein
MALIGVYTVAWIEQQAFGGGYGAVLFGITALCWAVLRWADARQRHGRIENDLDELVDLPTLRLGLMD